MHIERLLSARSGATFRVKGRCMFPTVRAGDLLRVRSCAVAEASIGDIAVFRKAQYLLAHRVIEKRIVDGRACVVTRPDGTNEGSDSPTFDDDFLGVVASIDRNGKPAPLEPTSYPGLVRRYFDARLRLMHAEWLWTSRFQNALKRTQRSPTYRHIANACLRLMNPRISYTVRLPVSAFGDAAYREMPREKVSLRRDWRGRPIDRWTLALHINGAREPAARATFSRSPESHWRIEELFLGQRYQGTKLKDALLREAKTILQRDASPQSGSGYARESDPFVFDSVSSSMSHPLGS